MFAIADLHCDLLSYLAGSRKRNAKKREVRCSLPQLKQGNVFFQVLAIYTETGRDSVNSAEKQLQIFHSLPTLYPEDCAHQNALAMPKTHEKVHIMCAIENASALAEEEENLESGFRRFDQYIQRAGPILYISFTWNSENRFGGGNQSKKGLTRDGEHLLDYLDGKKIAVDFSHASDALAYDIVNYIDKKGLAITPIASHSNFRKIMNQSRNLPDELAKEIIKRGGVIGLNFVRNFIGKNSPADFARHVDYARSLGGADHYCFGADFFYAYPFLSFFFQHFSDSSCYPRLLTYLNDFFTRQELEKIAYINFANFLIRLRS